MFSKHSSSGSTTPTSDSTPNTTSSTPTTIDHDNRLDGWDLVKAVLALNFVNGGAFYDIMGSPALLPAMAKDIGIGASASFVTTSSLIMAVVGQWIFNYLSDFLGRKIPLLLAIACLGIGTLGTGLCDVEQSLGMLILFRGLAGLGFGCISGLVNILQSDYLDKERRQMYQGFQGISVGLGSAIGPIMAAVFTEVIPGPSRWQYFYYVQVGLSVLAFSLVWLWVPARHSLRYCWAQAGGTKGLLGLIDWVGVVSGILAIVPTLILATQGSSMHKDAPSFIVCIMLAIVGVLVFLLNGSFGPLHGARPIMPFKFFRNRTILAIYMQNILLGFAYHTLIVYMPIYLTFVRQLTMLRATLFMLSYVCTHATCSTGSARVVVYLERRSIPGYTVVAFFGFTCWTIALAILTFVSKIADPVICLLLILVGLGTGCVFQNAVNSIRNEVHASENATALGTRNVLRYFGGALGTAINASVLQKSLKVILHGNLASLTEHPFDRPDRQELDAVQNAKVTEGYRQALQNVFMASAVAIAISLLFCFLLIKPRAKAVNEVAEMSSEKVYSSGSSLVASLDQDIEKQLVEEKRRDSVLSA